jgi:hypothetical protein
VQREQRRSTQRALQNTRQRNAEQLRGESRTKGLTSRENARQNIQRAQRNHNFVAAPRQQRRGRTARAANANRRLALRNSTFAHTSGRNSRALARATFHGRFANFASQHRDWYRHWHRRWWRRHPIVIGWFGPLFWPYAYADFVDYTYYPYAYDTFWPYAYDDVYISIFGPYAYGSDVYTTTYASTSGSKRTRANHQAPAAGTAEICSIQATQLTNWPIEQIADVVEPNAEQRAALEDLKNASAKAIDVLQSACPSELPSTPTGRLEAMQVRLQAMLEAVQIVEPALERFYGLLNDEQKARFNSFGEEQQQARTGRGRQPDLTQVCSGRAAGAPQAPMARIRTVLKLSDDQSAALDDLQHASQEAADILKANCRADESLTPPGRLKAMQTRLEAMLKAVGTVEPALKRFYGSLSDEQKARFNRLNRQEG